MFFGIAVFLLGSVLCGVAWSMPALIVARAVQGIGAGAVQPMSITIVGDLYSVEERARVQGYVASVWGAAVGRRPDARRAVLRVPAAGGGSSSSTCRSARSPRWMLCAQLPRAGRAAGAPRRLAGAVLLTTGFSLLILGLLEGGVAWDWASRRQRRDLRRRRAGRWSRSCSSSGGPPSRCCRCGCSAAACSSAATSHRVAIGASLIGLTSYVPTYVQGVLGTGALVAGFALAAMTRRLADRGRPVRPALPAHRLPATPP